MHGKCGATYESGSLRRYHLGRTETIRSCTLEAQKFAHAMAEEHNQTSSESKYTLFVAAIQAHRQYTNDVIISLRWMKSQIDPIGRFRTKRDESYIS